MSEHHKFIKRVGLVGIAKIVSSLRGLILFPILAKTLGPSNYGVWSQILITLGLFLPFVTLALPETMVRFLAAEKDKKNVAKVIFTIIFFILIIATIFALILFFSSSSFAKVLLKDSSASFAIRIASFLIILGALNQVSIESFRVFGQIKKYSAISILQTLLEILIVLPLVFFGFGLFGTIVAFLIADSLILLISLIFILSHVGFSRPDFSILAPYLAFALPLVPIGLFDTFINSSDRYVLGFFKGSAAVGIYSATYNIGLLAIVFIYPISYILAPTIFKLFDEKKIDQVKFYLSYSLKYFLLFSIPAVIGLTVLAKPLLRSLATSEFILMNSMLIVLIVALSTVAYGVQVIFYYIVMLKKSTKFFIMAFGIGGIVNLILNIVIIPGLGALGAAITTLIAYVLVAVIVYFESRKYIIFRVDFLTIIKSILVSLVMGIIIYFINPVGIIKVLLAVIFGGIFYFIMLFLLKGFSEREIKIFRGMFGRESLIEKY